MSESANLPLNFGGIDEPRYCDFDKSRVLILPVSYEGTVSYGAGTGAGAAAIIDASRNLELYDDETDAEIYKIGIHTLETFQPLAEPPEMMRKLYERAAELLENGQFICSIGGEHSISPPLIEAHVEKFYDLSVVQIDAHADLRDSYDGTKHSHASVMARVIKDLRIPAVQIGIRSMSAGEARLLSEGIPTKVFLARDIAGQTDWIDDAVECLSESVYLTIDVDGFDPSIMPATGTPEPGGLGWYEVLNFLSRLTAKKRVVGMDLVEFAPIANQPAPAFLCAKLIYQTLGYIFREDTPKVLGK